DPRPAGSRALGVDRVFGRVAAGRKTGVWIPVVRGDLAAREGAPFDQDVIPCLAVRIDLHAVAGDEVDESFAHGHVVTVSEADAVGVEALTVPGGQAVVDEAVLDEAVRRVEELQPIAAAISVDRAGAADFAGQEADVAAGRADA